MIDTPLTVFDTLNGRIQISVSRGSTIGLLVEREDLCCGCLLSPAQAHELANVLLAGSWLSELDDT
jgi:hypothetical protein